MSKLNLALGAVLLLSISACVSTDSTKVVESSKSSTLTKQLTQGKEISSNKCTKCHNSSVYTREDRKVKTLAVLNKRVQKCNAKTGAGLDEKELKSLTLFLNTEYYKFQK